MADEGKRKNLGRGLSALLGEEADGGGEAEQVRLARMVPVEAVRPGPFQPRRKVNEDEIKAIAARKQVEDGPDGNGDMFQRPAAASDAWPSPYANDNQARASNGGALPPDLSLLAKARLGGEHYIYALLTGYHEPPEGVEVRPGLYYNPYFPGHQIGMPPPLANDMVPYGDNTPATVQQMSHDVSVFLTWLGWAFLRLRRMYF